MKIKIYIAILLLILLQKVTAQDFHLSQFDAASLYLNPGITGTGFGKGHGDYRFNADYRSQWRSVASKPFTTAYIGGDMVYKGNFGLGGYIISNRAGAGKLNTLNAMASVAHNVAIDHHHHHYLSGGAQLGIFQRSYGNTNPSVNDQYSPSYGGFDPSLPNNETFQDQNNSIIRFDANFGVYYMYKNKKKHWNPFAGVALYHLTRPNASFGNGEQQRLPMRYVVHGGTHYAVSSALSIMPNFLFMYQKGAHELNLGILANYTINDSPNDVIVGCAYRTGDAFIVHAGFKQGLNTFRFSYDINTSALNVYSRGKGGYEFSIIYTGSKKKNQGKHGHPHIVK